LIGCHSPIRLSYSSAGKGNLPDRVPARNHRVAVLEFDKDAVEVVEAFAAPRTGIDLARLSLPALAIPAVDVGRIHFTLSRVFSIKGGFHFTGIVSKTLEIRDWA
jgi:hypothetical protein